MQAAQLQGLRYTIQGLHHGQVSGNRSMLFAAAAAAAAAAAIVARID